MGTINDYSTFAFFLQGYQASDQATNSSDSNVLYYGFVDKEGAWYIQEQTTSGTTLAWRYAKGTSGFTTNWALRESLTYETWNEAFK